MRMIPVGIENLVLVSDEARQVAFETSRRGGGGVDSKQEGAAKERKFKVGEMEFEAFMRTLDNAVSKVPHVVTLFDSGGSCRTL